MVGNGHSGLIIIIHLPGHMFMALLKLLSDYLISILYTAVYALCVYS